MRKLLTSLAVPLVAGLALSACNVHIGPYAAVVDGTTISQSQLNSALSSAAADTGYLCAVTSGFQVGIPTHGVGQGTYDTSFSDFVLGYRVRSQLAADQVASRHIAVTPLAETTALAQLTASEGSNVQGCSGSGSKVLDGLSSGYRAALVSLYADLDAMGAAKIGATLTPAGLAAYAGDHPIQTNFVCLQFIEVASRSKAAALRSQIEKGASFASVAAKNTIASSSTLPCEAPTSLPAPVATEIEGLPTGKLSQPFAFESDYLLLEVIKRQTPTPTQLLDIVVMQAEQEFPALVTSLDSSGSVQVDPAYGSWTQVRSSNGSPITPPGAPPARFVPSNSAVVASPSTPTASTTPASGAQPQG